MSIVSAEVSVPSAEFALGEILDDHGSVRIELSQFVPAGNPLAPYFWAEASDLAGFEERVEGDERVASLTAVDDGQNARLYHVRWDEPMAVDGFLETIGDHDLVVESAVGTDGTWQFTLQAPDHASLRAFQQSCADAGVPMTVHRVWNPTTDSSDPRGLTLDQRRALEVAARLGYFETPSKVTLDEIGAELDISSQAASKRIRGGVEKLVENALPTGE